MEIWIYDISVRHPPNFDLFLLIYVFLKLMIIVTHPLYESRMHWIPDPTPSPPRPTGKDLSVKTSDSPVPIPSDSVRPRDAPVKVSETSDTQASAIATRVPSGAPLTPSLPRKCRKEERKARRAANEAAAPVTPDERWANENTGIPGATQPQPEASDPTQMRRTAVYPGSSIHSHPFTQPPISTANENSALPLGLELCKFPGLYKPAVPDLRQDLTARPFRVNNSGSSLSSPPHLQPYTKPFSGRPARPYMACPTREAGGALRERSGIVYPLLPRTQRPDTNVAIDAALPEQPLLDAKPCRPRLSRLGPPASRSQSLQQGDALLGSPPVSTAIIALQECSGRPSARRPRDTGVIDITPFYKQLNEVTCINTVNRQ